MWKKSDNFSPNSTKTSLATFIKLLKFKLKALMSDLVI